MRQIALKRRVDAWLGKRHLPPVAQAFNGRSGLEWWRRLFLPADFEALSILCREENLECRAFVTEHLTVRDSYRTATHKCRRSPKVSPEP